MYLAFGKQLIRWKVLQPLLVIGQTSSVIGLSLSLYQSCLLPNWIFIGKIVFKFVSCLTNNRILLFSNVLFKMLAIPHNLFNMIWTDCLCLTNFVTIFSWTWHVPVKITNLSQKPRFLRCRASMFLTKLELVLLYWFVYDYVEL